MAQPIEALLEAAEDAVVDVAAGSGHHGEVRLRKVITDLKAAAKDHPKDDRIAYAIGYCWYNVPRDAASRTREAIEWLRTAVDINPDNYFALLYLGHVMFDERRYREARDIFVRIPKQSFSSHGQDWRDVKLQELIVCCDVYATGDVAAESMTAVLDGYGRVAIEDRPMPDELVDALLWLRVEQRKQLRPGVLAGLAALVSLVNGETAFRGRMELILSGEFRAPP